MSFMSYLDYSDGTDNKFRPIQTEILEWCWKHKDKKRLGICTDTGSGKSMIGRIIQEAEDASIIVPSNSLLNQYSGAYPWVNSLKGKAHYSCQDGVSCVDKKEILKEPPCENCPYKQAKMASLDGAPTIYNPMSYFYNTRHKKFPTPSTLIIDEADQLYSAFDLMSGKKFRRGKYHYPETTSIAALIPWIQEQEEMLEELFKLHHKDKNVKQANKVSRELSNLYFVRAGLESNPENYVIWESTETFRHEEEKFLNIQPLSPPPFLMKQMLNADRLIFMSATLFNSDTKFFSMGEEYAYHDFGSPIPVENRQVYYKPAPFKMNASTEPEAVAEQIQKVLDVNPGDNAIVHVTYGMARKLADLFPEAITHNKESKDDAIAQFKAKGGLFLASGCDAGLDLPYDECRLNIIPTIQLANPYDPVVAKKMKLPGGQYKYYREAMRKVIQQRGRSTRSATDFSKVYVLDNKLPWIYKKCQKDLPESFKQSIVWR